MSAIENILVLNAGSSSLKFSLYKIATEERLASGLFERVGTPQAKLIYRRGTDEKVERPVSAPTHSAALKIICSMLTDRELDVLKDLSQVDAIGHRVIHGAEVFKKATLMNAEALDFVKSLIKFGPLHLPPNIDGVEACEKLFPGVPNVAVFDTAFHSTIPDYAARYSIPEELYSTHGFRKYGFHGPSHKFVTEAAAAFLQKPLSDVKLVTCHLGNGSSLAAIKNGNVLDTTMGLTPLAGVMMGTRSGDIDPAIVLELLRQGKTSEEIDTIFNKKSGLYAIAGIDSGDMRDIINAAENGNERCRLALDMWAHRIIQTIGGYHTLIGGADAIVFTGGIGENSAPARERILSKLSAIGVEFNPEANSTRRGPCSLTYPTSPTAALVIPTDEELMIARETLQALS